jgi:predicted ATPase/DNA-binding winged helix-turn-helix (wHTH) protein
MASNDSVSLNGRRIAAKQAGKLPEEHRRMKQFGVFGLDTGNERLLRGSTPIALPPKPFAVLRYLVEHPGRLITHDELLEALWPETFVQPQVLRTYVLDLRKALEDDAGQPQFIQTVPKRGYRFLACVTESAGSTSAAPAAAAAPATHPPALAQLASGGSIVNRHAELESLSAQFSSARLGTRQLAFITGEAGIGKTALVDAFSARIAGGSAALVARGQCVEGLSRKEQYYPIMEAMSQLCASEDGEKACRILARMAPDWLAAMGRETAPQPGQRDRMPGDLCAALEELAADKPLLLVLEDLQWADDSTLHLVSALARRRAPAKLMIVANYRPQHVGADHPLRELKQDLRMRRLCAELPLAPLARTAVRELLSRELNQSELPASLVPFIHRRSEGNPLFVIAILEHLISEQYLKRDSASGQWRWVEAANTAEMEAGVPEGLAQMIEAEIARLGEQEQRMLEGASLMNVAFTTWAVAAALELDPAETEEAFQELARRLYFVERAGQDELPDGTDSTFYVFAHGLYREVLWQRQTEAKRARRHTRIAERLAKLFEGREGNVAREMAVHYEAAGNWQRAIASLRAAAGHALDRRAFAESTELLDRALRLTERLRESERQQTARDLTMDIQKARRAAERNDRELITSTKA